MAAAKSGSARRRGPRPTPTSAPSVRRWSQRVTERSDALDLEPGVFTHTAKEIARSLKRSADRSLRRKTSPFRSAMSMLTFFENRAGKKLSAARKAALRAAKGELRRLYGREPPTQRATGRGRRANP